VGRLFTVGHSTRTFDELVQICAANGVVAVVDVRRFPGSRRNPQFGRRVLESTLPANGIAYLWIPELGGRRHRARSAPPSPWRVAGFAAYADYMRGPDFRVGIDQLLAQCALGPTAVMCAEASPYRCHRRLISTGQSSTASRSCTSSTGGVASVTRSRRSLTALATMSSTQRMARSFR